MKFWVFVGSFLTLTVFGIVVQLFGKKICKVTFGHAAVLFHMITHTHTHTHTHRQTDRQTDRQRGGEEGDIHRQTDRQTDRGEEGDIHTRRC